jgi:chemotaxis protein MotB
MPKKAKAEEPAGESAPMWIVSFADLVTLMMSFFVVLYALKQGGPAQQMEMAAAIKAQFDYEPAPDSTDPLDLAVLRYKGRPRPMDMNKGAADNPARGAEGDHPEVQTIRSGKDVTSGGAILFGAGSVALDPDAQKTLGKLADILRGHNNVLILKGHVSPDELSLHPEDTNGMALSYQRASIVAEALVKLGLDRRVLRPTACGPFEPVRVQAYDPASQRQNRRVEIYSTDTLATDFVPSHTVDAAPAASAPGVPATSEPAPDHAARSVSAAE